MGVLHEYVHISVYILVILQRNRTTESGGEKRVKLTEREQEPPLVSK